MNSYINHSVKNTLARISIAVYVIMLISTVFMPATEGSLVPIFGLCAFFAMIPIMVGSKKVRIAGSVLLALAVVFIVADYMNGK